MMLRRYLARRKMRWAVKCRAWYRATGFVFVDRKYREVFMDFARVNAAPLSAHEIRRAIEKVEGAL